jgi:hypothetical protein
LLQNSFRPQAPSPASCRHFRNRHNPASAAERSAYSQRSKFHQSGGNPNVPGT